MEPSSPIPEPKSCLDLRHALRGAKLHSLVGDSIYGDVPITLWLATVSPGDLTDHFANGVRDLGKYNMDNPLADGHSSQQPDRAGSSSGTPATGC